MSTLSGTDLFVMQLIEEPLRAVVNHYASCLSAYPKAIQLVLQQLHLTLEEAASLKIGFSDRSLGTLIPPKQIKAGREIRDRLTELGIYKSNGRETLRGYVTVPLRNDSAAIVGVRGHKVDPHSQGPSVIDIGVQRGATDLNLGKPTKGPAEKEDEVEQNMEPVSADSCLIAQGSSLHFHCGDRNYRIRGLELNHSTATLRINLLVSRDSLVHLDSLDLVKASSRSSFVKAAASELYVDPDVIKKDLGRLLLQLEALQADEIEKLKKPKVIVVPLTAQEERSALELLRDPNLLDRIVADFEACGIVGEFAGKQVCYLAATSRKLRDKTPLAILIQASSAAGKSSLMDAVLDLMPPEDVLKYSGMTGRSLFYLDSDEVRHKTLAISEDEGASEANYALKLLQSEGELRHATVGRSENGRVATQSHHVQGPVQLFLTTTAMNLDEELVNRCLVLSVDESKLQTEAILSRQREACTQVALKARLVRDQIRKQHQNAQRLLRPLHVFNPFAMQLTFPSHKTRMRRDHVKYLTLIDTIALLHQHQRAVYRHVVGELEIEYIHVEKNDIAIANRLAGEVLGRSLDELAPQTRNLLGLLYDYVTNQSQLKHLPHQSFRFTRRDVREAIHWSDSQIRKHLDRLVGLEYVVVHRGRNGQGFVYELLYCGEGYSDDSTASQRPFLMGLIEPSKLKHPASMLSPMTITTTLTP